jgi:Zn-dependent peptidase ImmA (M78 family)
MGLKVAYMSDEAIEKDAQALLADYARERGTPIEAPIPIDDIIEKHLKIGIEFDDTHRLFDVPRSGIGFDPDILGAIFFDQKRIVIDESLDPDANPTKEGRYRYTTAHEVGHWRLHRGLFDRDPAQTSLLEPNAAPSVICRTSQAKERIELQADLYASCLLMPRAQVLEAWATRYNCLEAYCWAIHGQSARFVPRQSTWIRLDKAVSWSFDGSKNDDVDQCFASIAREFADYFKVSNSAMRIRLERLGLLHRTVPLQRLLTDGA